MIRRRPTHEPEPLSPGTPKIGRRSSGPTMRWERQRAHECLRRVAAAHHPLSQDWWILHAVANRTGEDIPDLAAAEAALHRLLALPHQAEPPPRPWER